MPFLTWHSPFKLLLLLCIDEFDFDFDSDSLDFGHCTATFRNFDFGFFTRAAELQQLFGIWNRHRRLQISLRCVRACKKIWNASEINVDELGPRGLALREECMRCSTAHINLRPLQESEVQWGWDLLLCQIVRVRGLHATRSIAWSGSFVN